MDIRRLSDKKSSVFLGTGLKSSEGCEPVSLPYLSLGERRELEEGAAEAEKHADRFVNRGRMLSEKLCNFNVRTKSLPTPLGKTLRGVSRIATLPMLVVASHDFNASRAQRNEHNTLSAELRGVPAPERMDYIGLGQRWRQARTDRAAQRTLAANRKPKFTK